MQKKSLYSFGSLALLLVLFVAASMLSIPAVHDDSIALAVAMLFASIAFGVLGVIAAGSDSVLWVLLLSGGALILGILLTIPIGGADMPVVISLLNIFTGTAAAMSGFVLQSPLLLIAGAVGFLLGTDAGRSQRDVILVKLGKKDDGVAGAVGDAADAAKALGFSNRDHQVIKGTTAALVLPEYQRRVFPAIARKVGHGWFLPNSRPHDRSRTRRSRHFRPAIDQLHNGLVAS